MIVELPPDSDSSGPLRCYRVALPQLAECLCCLPLLNTHPSRGLRVEDIDMTGGVVHAPNAPGLGYQVDWDLVKRECTGMVE